MGMRIMVCSACGEPFETVMRDTLCDSCRGAETSMDLFNKVAGRRAKHRCTRPLGAADRQYQGYLND